MEKIAIKQSKDYKPQSSPEKIMGFYHQRFNESKRNYYLKRVIGLVIIWDV